MFFDRILAKKEAKEIIRTVGPSPLLVTLIFTLLTTGVSIVIGFFASNPFNQALQYILNDYDPYDVYAAVFGGGRATVLIFVSILLTLYNALMNFGYYSYAIRLARREEAGPRNLLDGFNLAVKVVLLDLMASIFIFLWSLLFLIPGIIATYRYSQAVRCLIDAPEIGVMEAIRRSKTIMRGQKFNLFVLQMTFFGWFLLVSGVGNLAAMPLGGMSTTAGSLVFNVVSALCGLWLTPYVNIVNAAFYNHLVGWQKPSEGYNPYRGPELEF